MSGHDDTGQRIGGVGPSGAARRSGAGAAGLGLSYAHTARNERQQAAYKAEVWDGGNLLQVTDQQTHGAPGGGGRRGEVRGFSVASRRRLIYLLGSLDRRKLQVPLFVTLTYPGQDWQRFGGRKEEVKRHLDAFNHWLAYHHPEGAAIWRLEFQKRGAPHLHLLVFGVGFLDCHKLADEWYGVIGSGQESHLLAGTQVKACKSWGEATAYVAKYMAKLESFQESEVPIHSRPGRVWGVWRSHLLPRESVSYGLGYPEFVALRRIMRGLCKSKGYRLRALSSFSTFLSSDAGHRALAFVGADPGEETGWRSESPESYSPCEVQAEGEQ